MPANSESPSSTQWQEPPPSLALQGDEVHVWRAPLEMDGPTLSRLEANLSSDERGRGERFRFDRDRHGYVGTRGALRKILGIYLQRPPGTIKFGRNAYGKPFVDGDGGAAAPPLHFNVSHSGSIALLAFSRMGEVGVDVEVIRPEFAGNEIAERYFSRAEMAELGGLPPESRADAFFLCWTRKEAYVKARGAGLQISLGSFSVSLTPGRPETLDSPDSSRWTLRSLDAGPGFAAAIVAEGKPRAIHQWEWKPSQP